MSHGLRITTGSNTVLLSSDVEPFCYFGKAQHVGNEGNNTYAFETSCKSYPLVFMYIPQGESAAVVKISGTSGSWTIYVLATTFLVQLYIFDKASNIAGTASYGLKLYNKYGTETYDSSKKPLVVRDSLFPAPDGTYSFTACAKPIFAHFPFAIRETQTATSKSYDYTVMVYAPTSVYQCNTSYQYQCNYVGPSMSCSYVPVQTCGYVQQYVYTPTTATMTWTQNDWVVYRETLRLDSNSQFTTTWVANATGTYNNNIQNQTTGFNGSLEYIYNAPGKTVADGLTESSTSPYANSGINYQNYLCLVSDGALYD